MPTIYAVQYSKIDKSLLGVESFKQSAERNVKAGCFGGITALFSCGLSSCFGWSAAQKREYRHGGSVPMTLKNDTEIDASAILELSDDNFDAGLCGSNGELEKNYVFFRSADSKLIPKTGEVGHGVERRFDFKRGMTFYNTLDAARMAEQRGEAIAVEPQISSRLGVGMATIPGFSAVLRSI